MEIKKYKKTISLFLYFLKSHNYQQRNICVLEYPKASKPKVIMHMPKASRVYGCLWLL
jgi:hypothetical protein